MGAEPQSCVVRHRRHSGGRGTQDGRVVGVRGEGVSIGWKMFALQFLWGVGLEVLLLLLLLGQGMILSMRTS
jgi:hypothetical protein